MKVWIAAITIAAVHAGVLWHSIQNKSASVDELSHLAAGLYSTSTGDFRMNRTAPPMQNVVCALPVWLFHQVHLDYENESWRKGIWNGSGDRLLEANPGTFHALLLTGRTGTIVLSCLLCLVVFVWAKEVWGEYPSLLVLLVTAFEPNLMAHGRLTTTDLAPVLCFTLTGYLFWRFVRTPSWQWLIWIGVGFGLAWYAKHSGVVLLPALVTGIGIMASLYPQRFHTCFSNAKWLKTKWSVAVIPVLCTAIIFMVGCFVIWVGYGFEIGDSISGDRNPNQSYIWSGMEVPLRTAVYMLGYEGETVINSVDPQQPFWLLLRSYLPAFSHWEGYFANRSHLTTGHLGYFMGELSMYGWRSYYPVLFIIKTPAGLLLLLLIGVVLLALKKKQLDVETWIALSLFPLMYLLIIIFYNTANIGYRHALPAVPFVLILFAGAAFRYGMDCVSLYLNPALASSAGVSRPVVIVYSFIIVFCTVWQMGSVISQHPHHLSYFNGIIGGPNNGHFFAVDSNLDWGQDLLFVKDYMEEHEMESVNLLYFGPASLLDAYQVSHVDAKKLDRFGEGTYIVSATLLQGIGAGNVLDKIGVFRAREPDEYITPAVFVYRLPSSF